MNLTRIQARNFLGHRTFDLTIDKPVVLITGDLASGKSSIKDMVEFALTGEVLDRGITRKNQYPMLRHKDAGENARMKVVLDWEADGETQTLERNLSNGPANIKPNPMLVYCLHPGRFLDLSAAERAGVLATVFKPSEELIMRAVSKHVKNILEPIKEEIVASGVDICDLKGIREVVIDQRKLWKAEIKGSTVELPDIHDYELDDDYPDKVAGEKEQQRDLIQKIDAFNRDGVARGLREGKRTRLEEEIKGCTDTIAAAKKTIKAISPPPDCDSDLDLFNVIDLALTFTRECAAACDFKKEKGYMIVCPLCDKQVEYDWFEGRLDAVKVSMELQMGEWMKYNQQDECNKNAEQFVKQSQESICKLVKELKDMKDPQASPVSDGVMENITVDLLRKRIAAYEKYCHTLQHYQEQQKRTRENQILIAECNRIDKALADGGPVQAEIQANTQTLPINNELIKAWGFGELEICDNGEIFLGGLAVQMLSTSEKWRLSGAVAFALAEIGNVGFCWLDGFEVLLKDSKNALFAALDDVDFPVHTVFINVSTLDSMDNMPDWVQRVALG